jgi:hypothetical protein
MPNASLLQHTLALHVLAVFQDNTAARGFYARHGFRDDIVRVVRLDRKVLDMDSKPTAAGVRPDDEVCKTEAFPVLVDRDEHNVLRIGSLQLPPQTLPTLVDEQVKVSPRRQTDIAHFRSETDDPVNVGWSPSSYYCLEAIH